MLTARGILSGYDVAANKVMYKINYPFLKSPRAFAKEPFKQNQKIVHEVPKNTDMAFCKISSSHLIQRKLQRPEQ